MQTLLEQWAEVGIKARIDTIEQTAYIGQLVAGDFEAAYFRNYAYPDPDSLYSFWSKATAGGPISINFTQYWSANTERDLQTGRETTDFDTRHAAYDDLMRERNEQAIELWLFHTPVRDPRRTGCPRPELVPRHGLRELPAQALDGRALGPELTGPNGP